jgi:branched-chain amino acid transport system ATP-binding protein
MTQKSSTPISKAKEIMLRIKKLKVQYGPLIALQEISLEVRNGETVSLIGPNRAGKTTLLLTLSGILKTTEGRILFQEEDITNLRPHKIILKGLGHVPQGRHIFPTLSVIDNLKLGAYTKSKSRETSEDLEKIFQLFPTLKERVSQRAGTLSGGEQQMLAIGRSIMGRPKLLMLDEPSSGLSPRFIEELFSKFIEMNRNGLTLFIVEQEVYLSLSVSHRGYLLRNSRLIREGSSSDLMENHDVKALCLGEGLGQALFSGKERSEGRPE